MGYHAGDSVGELRDPRRELRLRVSRTETARGQGVREGALGRVREQPPGAILRAHPCGIEATGRGARRVDPIRHGNRIDSRGKVDEVEMLSGFLARVGALFRGRAIDSEIAEEMEAHLERETLRGIARGMSAGEASAAARRGFGNVMRHREDAREAYQWIWFEQIAQDVRYGARSLRRNPGFGLVAIASLAFAIGANTAIFGVMDALVVRRLPLPEPESLVFFRERTSPTRT